MCNKVDNKIECEPCGHNFDAASHPDNYDHPEGGLPCTADETTIAAHIAEVERLRVDRVDHPYDCLCLIHR